MKQEQLLNKLICDGTHLSYRETRACEQQLKFGEDTYHFMDRLFNCLTNL